MDAFDPQDSPQALTIDQKTKVLQFLNDNKKFNLKRLVEFVGGDDCDYRSDLGKLIRKYLEEEGFDDQIKAQAQTNSKEDAKRACPTELDEAQKQFIDNNSESMKFVEMAQTLFSNKKIAGFSPEVKLIVDYVKSKEGPKLFEDPNTLPTDIYKPPKSPLTVIQRINKYIHNNPFSDVNPTNVKKFVEELNPRLKSSVEKTIQYLHHHYFIHQMNSFTMISERELCEGAFIGYVYDKPDLTAEEVEQFILCATETVNIANAQKNINKMQALIDQEVETADPKLRMSLVEGLDNAREDYNRAMVRKDKLLSNLTVKRRDRIQDQVRANSSLVELILYWREAENRELFIKQAEIRKGKLKGEAKRIETLNDLIVEVWGLSPDELIDT